MRRPLPVHAAYWRPSKAASTIAPVGISHDGQDVFGDFSTHDKIKNQENPIESSSASCTAKSQAEDANVLYLDQDFCVVFKPPGGILDHFDTSRTSFYAYWDLNQENPANCFKLNFRFQPLQVCGLLLAPRNPTKCLTLTLTLTPIIATIPVTSKASTLLAPPPHLK